MKQRSARWWLSLVAFLLIPSVGLSAEPTKDSLDTVKQRLAKHEAVLLDVREKVEWDKGHLSDSQFLPLSDLKAAAKDDATREKMTKELKKDQIVYCHCAKGVRALSAADLLKKWGYDVRPLAAGYDQLREAGFPATPK